MGVIDQEFRIECKKMVTVEEFTGQMQIVIDKLNTGDAEVKRRKMKSLIAGAEFFNAIN